MLHADSPSRKLKLPERELVEGIATDFDILACSQYRQRRLHPTLDQFLARAPIELQDCLLWELVVLDGEHRRLRRLSVSPRVYAVFGTTPSRKKAIRQALAVHEYRDHQHATGDDLKGVKRI